MIDIYFYRSLLWKLIFRFCMNKMKLNTDKDWILKLIRIFTLTDRYALLLAYNDERIDQENKFI